MAVRFNLETTSRLFPAEHCCSCQHPAVLKVTDGNLQKSLQVLLGKVKRIYSAPGMPHFCEKQEPPGNPETMELKNSGLISK